MVKLCRLKALFHVEHHPVSSGKESIMTSKITKTKPRLGRGLSSLISVSDPPIEAAMATNGQPPDAQNEAKPPITDQPAGEIDLSLITPNPHQPRKNFDQQGLNELAATIKS